MVSINPVSYSSVSTQSYLGERGKADKDFFGKDGFSVGTVIDTINPLKHLPIVSSIYDKVTGAEPASPASKLAGGALYGGVLGFVTSLLDSMMGEGNGGGKSFTSNVLALFDNPAAGPTALAAEKYQTAQELSAGDEVKNASTPTPPAEKFDVLSISI